MAYLQDNKQEILDKIDGWQGKLSWGLLGLWCQDTFGLTKMPSRHTLQGDGDIKLAFQTKKKRLREQKETAIEQAKQAFNHDDPLSVLLSKHTGDNAMINELIKRAEQLDKEVERLTSTNERLESTNNKLLERFARWQSNLSRMDNVDLNKLAATLDTGLPKTNRR